MRLEFPGFCYVRYGLRMSFLDRRAYILYARRMFSLDRRAYISAQSFCDNGK